MTTRALPTSPTSATRPDVCDTHELGANLEMGGAACEGPESLTGHFELVELGVLMN